MSPQIFFRVPLSQEHKNLLRQKKHPVGCFFFVTAIVFLLRHQPLHQLVVGIEPEVAIGLVIGHLVVIILTAKPVLLLLHIKPKQIVNFHVVVVAFELKA